MRIKINAHHSRLGRVILAGGLCSSLIGPCLAAGDVDQDAAPVSAWDEIIARAKAGEAAGKTGWDRDRASLENRDRLMACYATYAGWTPPPPLPVKSGYLRNLADKPDNPRFPLTGKIWPDTVGAASVCLWEDDKVAAASVSVDDNCAMDLPNWRKISAQYGGLAVTWNLITKDISADETTPSNMGGSWAIWRQIVAEGFRVESHSVSHLGDPVREDGWPGPEWEAWESKAAIEKNIPGYRVRLFVYPGAAIPAFSVSSHWRDEVTEYYLGARGVSGVPINRANQTDYFDIRTTSNPGPFIDVTDKTADWVRQGAYAQILNPDPKNPNYRGWATVFTHFLGKGGDDLQHSTPYHQGLAKTLSFFNDNRKDIWIGPLADVALYGAERDTATVGTMEAGPARIVFELTSKMDPTYYDYPLTVKVRLPDNWKACAGQQAGKLVPVSLLKHDGGTYALVKAIPNHGPVSLMPDPVHS